MDLDKKYTLLESIPGHGASSFRGRQLASGREVTVHLVSGERAQREALLLRIRALPPESLGQVVEVGEQEGTLYLVTPAPPHRHFSEWFPEQEPPSSAATGLAEATTELRGTTGAAEPGEFTRFFRPGPLGPDPVPLPAAETPRVGEFTRLFGPADAPGQPGPGPGKPLDAAHLNPPNATQGPGEYTRIIGQSLTPAARYPDQTAAAPAPQSVHPGLQVDPGSKDRRMVSPVVTLVLCLLAFAAGATLVFLILRH